MCFTTSSAPLMTANHRAREFGRRWRDRLAYAQLAVIRLSANANAVPTWPEMLGALSHALEATTAILYTRAGEALEVQAHLGSADGPPSVPAYLRMLDGELPAEAASIEEAAAVFTRASVAMAAQEPTASPTGARSLVLPLIDGVAWCGWLTMTLDSTAAPEAFSWDDLEALSRLLGQWVGRIRERARREIEKVRLSTLLSNLGSAVLVEDSERRIVLVNQEFCSLFGIPAPPEALVGADCSEAAQQAKHLFADPGGFVTGVEELLQRREVAEGVELHFADGRVFERDYVPVFLDGAYLGHLWNYRDVTTRVREAKATEHLRNLYAQVLASMPAQLAVFDLEARYVYVSPSAVRDPDTRAWLIGRTDGEFAIRRGLDPSIGARRSELLLQVARDKSNQSWEESFPDREGVLRTYVRSISPVLDSAGEITQVLGYGLDITERRQAETAVREREALLRAVLESAIDAVVTFDASGRLLELSPSAERMFEVRDGGDVMPLPIQRLYDRIEPLLPAGAPERPEPFMRRLRMTLQRQSGESFPAEVGITTATMPNGQRICSAFVQDVTWRQQAETQLVAAMEKAEAAVRAQEEFLAHMSHELRTPLNAVIGMVHLLERQHPQPEQTPYLRAIYTSATTLLRTISDILDFSKISAGGVERDDSAFRLAPTIRDLVEPIRLQALAKPLRFRLDIADDVPAVVRGDQLRLGQILLNLLSNALRFTRLGEIGLRVSVEERTRAKTVVRFEIADTGIGIPADSLAFIFEPFRQADERVARAYGGTGLGLSIAKRLVELKGGSVAVESTPGTGTRFTLLIPYREATEAEVHAEPSATYGELPDGEMGDLTGVRILLAEDNELNRVVARELLRSAGAFVAEVVDGVEVVQALQRDPYDLILMDLQMPGMDGYSATRAIRQLPEHRHREIPIVALTASALLEERRRASAEGIQGFVTKPFSPTQLVAAINAVLHRDGSSAEALRIATPAHSAAAVGVAPAPPATATATAIDLEVLENSTLGQRELRLRVLDLLLQHAPPLQQQLQASAGTFQHDSLRAIAHRLCGSASTIGARHWESTLREVERRVEQRRTTADVIEAVEASAVAGEAVFSMARELLSSSA